MAVHMYRNSAQMSVFVWNSEDIIKLRTQYRIVGKLIGCHPHTPRQNVLLSKPLMLMPEEVTLLIEKGLATLYKEMPPDHNHKEKRKSEYDQLHRSSLAEQKIVAAASKKEDIISKADKIYDGMLKKKKLKCGETKDQIVQSLIDSIQPLDEGNMLVQQYTENPWKQDSEEIDWNYPYTNKERLRYIVFRDLWQNHFHLTAAAKFGGDFLVYPGDPENYHSKYIATCQQKSMALDEKDVVVLARLASNVKKTALLCSVDEKSGDVEYTTLDYEPSVT